MTYRYYFETLALNTTFVHVKTTPAKLSIMIESETCQVPYIHEVGKDRRLVDELSIMSFSAFLKILLKSLSVNAILLIKISEAINITNAIKYGIILKSPNWEPSKGGMPGYTKV